MSHIYVDHNASTPLCPAARQAILRACEAGYGNPSAGHWAGQASSELVARARAQVAEAFEVEPDQVIFTSGGTEGDNHALQAGLALRPERPGLAVSTVEHPAVGEAADVFSQDVRRLPVDDHGQVDVAQAAGLIDASVALVSVMHANNETGVLQPVGALATLAREAGALCHSDAAQSVGKVPVTLDGLGCDLLSAAGHKFGAPKGVGFLLVRAGLELPSFLHGGGHEQGRRPGTENTIGIAALGAACAAIPERLQAMARLQAQRDAFEAVLQRRFAGQITVFGGGAERVPNTSMIGFHGRRGAEVLAALPELAASTGSACHAGRVSMSPVLSAMAVDEDAGLGAVRFSFGPENSDEELAYLTELICERLPAGDAAC